MKPPRHPVTDHAVVRYLERVQGWNIDMVREHIADLTCAAIDVGASAKIIDGFAYKFANGYVVTIIKTGPSNVRTKND